MYDIELTPQAIDDLRWFRKHEQQEIAETINQQLRYEPVTQARNRKPMRPNDIAEWELRVRHFRILYSVDTVVRIVEIQRIGEKRGNRFFFRGREEDV
ncbi:type II toxin-antitoxin system RelE/ParE family toxin [Candidatus Chloroploca sp. Khr17]|uniref:type II toxin-antitoxin system RelE family toxin n=1 Tax=Candidatus Chloroploca sp. Khr17 TaxID=2496869 RepID=UPI00101CE565|nr:type II toxin-antitoxin system RelE/ParE family toxin [Candidatus Chloroploca sp. Khr17]